MWATNLKVGAVVLGTILCFTLLANAIPQVQSEVPGTLTLSADVTPAELVAAGEQLYHGAGACSACHGTGTRAPNLLTAEGVTGAIGGRCGDRVPGESCKEYLYRSLMEPAAYVVDGYQPIMPAAGRTLSDTQIWALVAYLEAQGGEVTVTGADLAAAEAAAGGPPAGTAGPAPAAAGTGAPAGPTAAVATLDPLELMRAHQCLACHLLGSEGGPIGPPFDGIGSRLDAATLRTSILIPGESLAAGYEALAGIMPANFGSAMTAAQLEAVVRYLADLK